MRSSASTPNLPPEKDAPGLPLWVVLACEDNPRLCTGRRVLRAGLAREPGPSGRPRRGALLLAPHADVPVTAQDEGTARRSGIVAIDCSWNRLGRRGGFPSGLGLSIRDLRPRRLPFLLAANPQHYGRVGELNTAEALGAAVHLTAGKEAADAFFARLGEGGRFEALNAALLEDYRGALGPLEIPSLERRYLP
jgi:pre-rRNA-processing protein TSR3